MRIRYIYMVTIAPPPAPPPSAPYCWDLPLPELNHLHYPNTVNWTVPADCKLLDGSTTPACYRDCDYFAGFDQTDLALQDAETHARLPSAAGGWRGKWKRKASVSWRRWRVAR